MGVPSTGPNHQRPSHQSEEVKPVDSIKTVYNEALSEKQEVVSSNYLKTKTFKVLSALENLLNYILKKISSLWTSKKEPGQTSQALPVHFVNELPQSTKQERIMELVQELDLLLAKKRAEEDSPVQELVNNEIEAKIIAVGRRQDRDNNLLPLIAIAKDAATPEEKKNIDIANEKLENAFKAIEKEPSKENSAKLHQAYKNATDACMEVIIKSRKEEVSNFLSDLEKILSHKKESPAYTYKVQLSGYWEPYSKASNHLNTAVNEARKKAAQYEGGDIDPFEKDKLLNNIAERVHSYNKAVADINKID